MRVGHKTQRHTMVLANKITIGRIFLIPVIIASILLYGESVNSGEPVALYRWLGIVLFVLAALSDALDGYIARKFNQRTWVGELIDPLADKTLMMSTILALTFTPWPWSFPVWFPVLVIIRDVLAILGGFLVYHLAGQIDIKVHWSGKAATLLQICAICWVMLGIPVPSPYYVTVAAAGMTVLAGLIYLRSAVLQVMYQNKVHP